MVRLLRLAASSDGLSSQVTLLKTYLLERKNYCKMSSGSTLALYSMCKHACAHIINWNLFLFLFFKFILQQPSNVQYSNVLMYSKYSITSKVKYNLRLKVWLCKNFTLLSCFQWWGWTGIWVQAQRLSHTGWFYQLSCISNPYNVCIEASFVYVNWS